MTVNAIASKLQRLLCVGLATLVIGSGLLFGFSTPATALGNEAGDIVQGRAERELDRITKGGDTVNQVKLRAQEGLGGVSDEMDKGTDRNLGDRARKDLDRTQSAVEEAGDAAKDSAEGVVDSVKGFFNR